MILAYTKEHEIKKNLENLKPKQSTGHGAISKEIPESCSPIIEKYLTTLFIKSTEDRIFLETMKTAKVIQFFKKGDKIQLEKYRRISLFTKQIIRKIPTEKNANVCDRTQITEPQSI